VGWILAADARDYAASFANNGAGSLARYEEANFNVIDILRGTVLSS